jgi:hypothetical protein
MVRLLRLANQLRDIEGFYGEQLMRSVTRLTAVHHPGTLILDFTRVGNIRSTDGHVRARSTFVERVKRDCIELSEITIEWCRSCCCMAVTPQGGQSSLPTDCRYNKFNLLTLIRLAPNTKFHNLSPSK